MEQSASRESRGDNLPRFMEHRWGQRMACRARVRIIAGAGLGATGRMRDVSSSGAFIETVLDLPMHARVVFAVLGNDSATHAVEMNASVARVAPDGIGIEWCDAPAGSICAKLGCATRCAAPG